MKPVFELDGVVRWSDTDASGRFHHACAFAWAEEAEHAFYRSLEAGVDAGAFPRRAVEATFEESLFAGDRYRVELSALKLGSTSLTWGWQIRRGETLAVLGRTVCVHVGRGGNPEPLPPWLRSALEGRTG